MQSSPHLAALNPANMPGKENLKDGYVKLDDAGNAYAVGALSFCTTFVTKTDYAVDAPAAGRSSGKTSGMASWAW